MQLKCPCGKVLKVPDTAAGKRVKCPGCGKVLQVPASSSAPTPSPDSAAPSVPSDKILVECSCGQKLSAPVSAIGKQVRCPSCGKPVSVSGSTGDDGFSLDLGSSDSDSDEEDGGDEYGVASPTCPTCGARLAPAAQFCVSCGTHVATGTRVDGVDMEAIEQKKTEVKKARYGILIIVVAAVIVCVGSVIVLLPSVIAKFVKSNIEIQINQTTPDPTPPPSDDSNSGAIAPEPSGSSEAPAPVDAPPQETVAPAPPAAGSGEFTAYENLDLDFATRGRARKAQDDANHSVELYRAANDFLPGSVAELEQAGFTLPELPAGLRYDYNPTTGAIQVGR